MHKFPNYRFKFSEGLVQFSVSVALAVNKRENHKMRISSHTLNLEANSKLITAQGFVQDETEWAKLQPSIPQFYAGQEIFVTGGSGFMGKVLIEKLLRSCPDIKVIFILLRPKRGKTIEERLQKILDLPLYQPLKNFNSKLFEKLIPISGNVAEMGLGISGRDYSKLQNVSIIFHSAASVRFDDSLEYAMMMNTRGTRELIILAKNLKNLKVFQYVSTTYSHPELKVVGEVIHEPYTDWRKAIQICEKTDGEILDILTPKFIQFMPNTYTFTKALAEQIISDYQNDLPIVLFRPSIVISSMKEPFPGWLGDMINLKVKCMTHQSLNFFQIISTALLVYWSDRVWESPEQCSVALIISQILLLLIFVSKLRSLALGNGHSIQSTWSDIFLC